MLFKELADSKFLYLVENLSGSSFEMWFVPIQVLSGRNCSNLRRNTPLDSVLAKGRSSVRAFSFLYVSRYSTQPNNEFGHSSKRRSRGPVMAAKKASEGLHLTACILS